MPVTVEVKGFDELASKLEAAPALVLAEAEDAGQRSLEALKPDLSSYPPELPNQKYVRTFTLKGGWVDTPPEFQSMSSGFEVSLTNPTWYGPYVQEEGEQIDSYKEGLGKPSKT